MSRWLMRIGILFIALGMLLLSPLSDLMPVDMVGIGSPPMAASHFRAVPGEDHPLNAAAVMIVVGTVLVCVGLLTRRRI